MCLDDADEDSEIPHFAVFVKEGVMHAKESFTCTNEEVELGVTDIIIVKFSTTYDDSDVATYLDTVPKSFWENINNFNTAVTEVAETVATTITETIEEAANAVSTWWETYIEQPWSRRRTDLGPLGEVVDGFSRIIFGEVRKSASTEIDGTLPLPDNPTQYNTRARNPFEWLETFGIPAAIEWIWNSLKQHEILGPFFTALEEGIYGAITAISTWWDTYVGGPFSRGTDAFDGIARVFFREVRRDGSPIPDGYERTSQNTRAKTITEWIVDNTSAFAEGIGKVIFGTVTTISDWLSEQADAISEALGPIWKSIKTMGETAWETIRNFGGWVWNGLSTVVGLFGQSFSDTATAISNFITKTGGEFVNYLFNEAPMQLTDWLKGAATTIEGALKGIKDSVWSGLVNLGKTTISALSSVGNFIWNGLKTIGGWFFAEDSNGEIYGSPSLTHLIGRIRSGVREWIIGADKAISDWLNDQKNAITTFVFATGTIAYDWLADNVIAAIDKAKNYVTESIDCLLYTSPSPRDRQKSRMPSSA